MIRNSIITFFILMVGYTFFIYLNPALSASQHQWQDNVVKAEQLLFDKNISGKQIILGSSLSSLLKIKDEEIINLAFTGKGVFDGLRILEKCSELPLTIFIETNYLNRIESTDFTSTVLSPYTMLVRKHFLPLRSDKQPLALVGDFVARDVWKVFNPVLKRIDTWIFGYHSESTASKNKKLLLDKMLEIRRSEYAVLVDSDKLDQIMRSLRRFIDYFHSKRGVGIVFFEMPVNPELQKLPFSVQIRKAIQTNFPEIPFLLPPVSVQSQTKDGIHLTPEEAAVYSAHFVTQTRSISNKYK